MAQPIRPNDSLLDRLRGNPGKSRPAPGSAITSADSGMKPATPLRLNIPGAGNTPAKKPLVNDQRRPPLRPDIPQPLVPIPLADFRRLDGRPGTGLTTPTRAVLVELQEAIRLAQAGLWRAARRPDGMPVRPWERTKADKERTAAAKRLVAHPREHFPKEASQIPPTYAI